MLCGRYSEAAVIAGECDDRNRAVIVIARWSLWASSGERVTGNSVYIVYFYCVCYLSLLYFYEFSVDIFTHYEMRYCKGVLGERSSSAAVIAVYCGDRNIEKGRWRGRVF